VEWIEELLLQSMQLKSAAKKELPQPSICLVSLTAFAVVWPKLITAHIPEWHCPSQVSNLILRLEPTLCLPFAPLGLHEEDRNFHCISLNITHHPAFSNRRNVQRVLLLPDIQAPDNEDRARSRLQSTWTIQCVITAQRSPKNLRRVTLRELLTDLIHQTSARVTFGYLRS
jgi:hypothetical protein